MNILDSTSQAVLWSQQNVHFSTRAEAVAAFSPSFYMIDLIRFIITTEIYSVSVLITILPRVSQSFTAKEP